MLLPCNFCQHRRNRKTRTRRNNKSSRPQHDGYLSSNSSSASSASTADDDAACLDEDFSFYSMSEYSLSHPIVLEAGRTQCKDEALKMYDHKREKKTAFSFGRPRRHLSSSAITSDLSIVDENEEKDDSLIDDEVESTSGKSCHTYSSFQDDKIDQQDVSSILKKDRERYDSKRLMTSYLTEDRIAELDAVTSS